MEEKKPMLHIQYGNDLLKDYEQQGNRLTTEKLLTMLRKEYRMSHYVYGNKLVRAQRGSQAEIKATQEYCERMLFIKTLGTILKERVGVQKPLFKK